MIRNGIRTGKIKTLMHSIRNSYHRLQSEQIKWNEMMACIFQGDDDRLDLIDTTDEDFTSDEEDSNSTDITSIPPSVAEDEASDPQPVDTNGHEFMLYDKKIWLAQLHQWLQEVHNVVDIHSRLEDIHDLVEEIEQIHIDVNVETICLRGEQDIRDRVLESIMTLFNNRINTDDVTNTFAEDMGRIFMTLFEHKDIYISVKKLSFMFNQIDERELTTIWSNANPVNDYKDAFGIFIRYIYKPSSMNQINKKSWISSFNPRNQNTNIKKSDVICGFFGERCAKIYELFNDYLTSYMDANIDYMKTLNEPRINDSIARFREAYGNVIPNDLNIRENIEAHDIEDERGIFRAYLTNHELARQRVVQLRRTVNYDHIKEKARIRNDFVDKLDNIRLCSAENVRDFFKTWQEYDTHFVYFEDALYDFSNLAFQNFFANILLTYWFMDNYHVHNIAQCINVMVEDMNEVHDDVLMWKVAILKIVLFKKCNVEQPEQHHSLIQRLLGEFNSLTSTIRMTDIQDIILGPPHDLNEYVLRGEHSLALVNRVNETGYNNDGQSAYRIVEKSPHRRINNRDIVVLESDELSVPDFIQIKKHDYLNWLHMKSTYVRIGSWNVSCTNNTDVPTTQDELNTKIDNIINVIKYSFCDLIALQELRVNYTINLNENEKVILTFEEFRSTLLRKLFEKTYHNWDLVKSHAFHESTMEIRTKKSESQEVYAFLFNADVIAYTSIESEVQKVLDTRSKELRLSRLPCFGKFKSKQLDIILCNMHLAPKPQEAMREIKDIGRIIIPSLQEQFPYNDHHKVVFLGDFNMSYTDRGQFARPLPDHDTWSCFTNAQYKPCITDCYTNVRMDRCYDNIWMHYTLHNLRCQNRSIVNNSTADRGVFNLCSLPEIGIELIGERTMHQFRKKFSDHNLVYVDLKNNEPMHWTTRPQVVINESV